MIETEIVFCKGYTYTVVLLSSHVYPVGHENSVVERETSPLVLLHVTKSDEETHRIVVVVQVVESIVTLYCCVNGTINTYKTV